MFKKVILFGLLVFIALAVSLFAIQTEIKASKKSFFTTSSLELLDQIVDLEKFNRWDPRAISDSVITVEYVGDPGLGMKSITKGKEGQVINEYEVSEIEPLRRVDIKILLSDQNELTYQFIIDRQAEGVELTWSVSFEAPLFLKVIDIESQLLHEFEQGFIVLREELK